MNFFSARSVVLAALPLALAVTAAAGAPAMAADAPKAKIIHTVSKMTGGDLNNKLQITGLLAEGDKDTPAQWSPTGGTRKMQGRSTPGNSATLDINEKGVSVGWGSPNGTESATAVRWSADGKISKLNPNVGPADAFTTATAINDADEIVGNSTWRPEGAPSRAVGWSRAANGTVKALPGLVADARTGAEDINAAGQVVGWSETADGNRHAVVWDRNGVIRDLGALSADETSEATSINDRGQVVGVSGYRSFVWDAAKGMVELASDNFITYARNINESGWVIGSIRRDSGDNYDVVAWDPTGVMHDLQTVVNTDRYGIDGGTPMSINDKNQVLVHAEDFKEATYKLLVIQLS